MATTGTRKTTTKNTVTTTDNSQQVLEMVKQEDMEKIAKENEELKNQMITMQNQMNILLQQIATLNLSNVNTVQEDKDIEVVSLVNATLTISTNGRSDGKVYEFRKQFETMPIPASDLKEIVRAMPNTAREGYYYILDPDFVRNNGLSSSYRNILNQTEMANILNLPSKEFLAKYQSASDAQKKIIESMLINKKMMGEDVDANIMFGLQKLTGRNYMEIEPLNMKEE